MPDQEKHVEQASRNEKLAQELAGTTYTDWAMVSLFYAAFHLVDAYFDLKGITAPENHGERIRVIARLADLRPVAVHYAYLYDQSWLARYRCVRVAQAQVAAVHRQNYVSLKRCLYGLLGIG